MASRSRAADGWWRRSTEAALLAALLLAVPEAQSPRALPDLVRAYVERFEQEASALVAEEHYTQVITRTLRRSTTETQTRVLRSDFVLVKPADSGPWLGYRDVFEVDGKEVRERDARLLQILESTAPDSLQRAQRMADEGARFNIGPARTINIPTMPLQLLAARYKDRIRLRVGGRISDSSGRILLTFEERTRPTIVRTHEGWNVKTSGEVIVRPDGAILMATLVFQFELPERTDPRFTMRVYYQEVPGHSVLLPLAMSEELPAQWGSGTGEARYSNYRRFQTATRIR